MKIYYAKISELLEEEMQRAMFLLPKERIEKITRTQQKKNQLQSIYAGILLEYALKEIGVSGKTLTFQKNADGKPFIKELPEFHYNLSHSKEYAALVVDTQAVGIDVEEVRAGYQKLATRFFSEKEISFLLANWSDELFTKFWTRKESYLKVTGYGMRMPLDAFSTLGSQIEINEKMPKKMIEEDTEFYLESIQIDKDYWMSVCRKNVPIGSVGREIALIQVDIKGFLEKG